MTFIVDTWGDIGSGPTSAGGDGIGGMITAGAFSLCGRGDGVGYGNRNGNGGGGGHFDYDE